MKMNDLVKLFTNQSAFVNFEKYENEYETMRLLYNLPKQQRERYRNLSLRWLDTLKNDNDFEKDFDTMLTESTRLREKGNKLFVAKRDERNILDACRFYTEAILAAPSGGNEALALAHANRAAALQAFGYYAQAYDDCECALAAGYPNAKLYKVITRQAYCAFQMRDVEQLRLHLDSLHSMRLNDSFNKQLQKLDEGLKELLQQQPVHDERATSEGFPPHSCETHEIICSPGKRGRHMIAKQFIAENGLIFAEYAPSFVPIGDSRRLCQECASTHFVPFPCKGCHGRVVYCSLKCQRKHSATHSYECGAYRRQLFGYVGIAHLAFRCVLDGLPTVASLLQHKRNAAELWTAFTFNNELLDDSTYGRTLRLISHLDKMSKNDIIWFALMAQLLLLYLTEHTTFLNLFDNMCASRADWELIVGSLILRHIGQLIVNAHSSISIVPLHSSDTSAEVLPLFDNVWMRPHHLARGLLHRYSYYEGVAAINLPHLSVCNHSCVPSFRPKFSGRNIYAFASRNIKAGEEIYNCYTLDYRKTRREDRRSELKTIYHFDCECVECLRPKADENYFDFRRNSISIAAIT